jgi:ABC-type bacteriocin/lantibiotic exporter with double-glycine peptidase domain
VCHLRALTRVDVPVICAVRDDDGGGHWVVVRGVERGRVYFHCPLKGPRSRPEDEWVANWHDVGMLGDRFESYGIAAW